MTRSLRTAIAVAVAIALSVATVVPAMAAANAPKGTLTSTEYTQLTAEQVAFKELDKKKDLTWNDFYKACHIIGQSTGLLRSVRSNCDTGIGFDQSLTGFYSDFDRCAELAGLTGTTTSTTTTSTGATTTGTTTTGTGTTTTGTGTTTTSSGTFTSQDLKLYACLEPEYAVISRAVESVYKAQAALRSQVLARDFVGRCEPTLAPSIAQLKALTRFVATSRQLTRDVALITKVANGQKPESAINEAQIQKDAAAFDAAAVAFEKIQRPQKLSVCPHA
jgi:hypothetical protein